jgi:DNA-binding winged helix-turn-helix (wHTH) protein/tetratricopeptide (TPR) repeat protein
VEAAKSERKARFGVFELDPRAGELRKGGTRIRLQIQPLKVLMALLEEPGAVVTREQLKARIWPNDSFGDFDHAVSVAVAKLRAALADSADTPRYIETLPRRGYRFIFPVTAYPAAENGGPQLVEMPAAAPVTAAEPEAKAKRFPRKWMAVGIVVALAVGGAVWWWSSRNNWNRMTGKDTLVVADFVNTTGDPVFDGALRQGLAVQLEQSPFFNLVSDERVKETLQLMDQEADVRVTPEIARQVCQRTQSTATIEGSIAKLGNQYVMGLKAVNCRTGDVLTEEQVTADAKERVLNTLAGASVTLREKLGETLSMVNKYNTPVERVTTSSLDALQAYSTGRSVMLDKEDHEAAVNLFQRAIELDPNFAMAYASLGMAYEGRSEKESLGYYKMAHDLVWRASEREKFYIEAHYQEYVTGDWEMTREVYELWTQTYPRDDVPHFNLSGIYLHLGQFDKAREEAEESERLLGTDCLSSGAIIEADVYLNHLDEAERALHEAREKKLECGSMHVARYALAFLRKDSAVMNEEINRAAGKSGTEMLLYLQAPEAYYAGELTRAREFYGRGIEVAGQKMQQELQAYLLAVQAESEALVGDPKLARELAGKALRLSKGSDVEGIASFALALAGDSGGAEMLVEDLNRRFMQNTLVQANYLPVTRAQLALNRKDFAGALKFLQAAAPYELGDMHRCNVMYPVYLRGVTYLSAHENEKAATEFRKIVEHRALVLSDPVGTLAELGLARAYAAAGDSYDAKTTYAELLTSWKNADPRMDEFVRAKAEYSRIDKEVFPVH